MSTPAKNRILKAAFELISRKGYGNTSTREIASLAQVAEVTIFRHFTSKANLFGEVLRSFSSIPAMKILIPGLRKLPYETAVQCLAIGFIERLDSNREWIRVLTTEVEHAPEEMQNVYADFLQNIFRILTEFFVWFQTKGELRDGLSPEYAARAFHSMIYGFFHIEGLLGVKSGLIERRRELIDEQIEVFCRGTRK